MLLKVISEPRNKVRKLNALVGTKVSINDMLVQIELKGDKRKHYGSEPIRTIYIVLTRKDRDSSLRGTSLSTIQREYHNESTEKSPTDLADDRQLSGARLAGVVRLMDNLESMDLVLTSEA